MTLFKPAESTSAYLKMGLLGFAGSGKTKTASLTAIGLVKMMREHGIPAAEKPVFFIDTETGSDWVKPDFDAAGVPLMVAKTRAFRDLLTAVKEAQANGSALIVDSISHFWKELCDSYSLRKAQQFKCATYRLQFQDWGYLKGEWGKFTDAYINSPVHIILAGRAGYEYDYFENDEGKKELEKTGVKMKAEGEMGYEPSLLVLMERHQKLEGNSVVETWREATVLKDRSTKLDGKVIVNPKFSDFLPHIQLLNLGGQHLGVDTTRTSEHAISADKKDWNPVQRKIVLGEIQDILVMHIPGQTVADKQRKVGLLKQHFGAGWVEIEEVMSLVDLRAGYDSLHRELEGGPSRYAALLAPGKPADDGPIDELPDHSAPPATAPALTGKSLEEQLLADIPNLATMADCLSWAQTVAKMEGLEFEARQRINAALLTHQSGLMGRNAANGATKPGRRRKSAAVPPAAEGEPVNPLMAG